MQKEKSIIKAEGDVITAEQKAGQTKKRKKETTIEQFKKYKICDYDSLLMNEVAKLQLAAQGKELLRHGSFKNRKKSPKEFGSVAAHSVTFSPVNKSIKFDFKSQEFDLCDKKSHDHYGFQEINRQQYNQNSTDSMHQTANYNFEGESKEQ